MPRVYTVLILVTICACASAQIKPTKHKSGAANQSAKARKQDEFLQKQWWIGLKGGVNLTQALPQQRYTVLTGTGGYPVAQLDKSYDAFNRTGSQAA